MIFLVALWLIRIAGVNVQAPALASPLLDPLGVMLCWGGLGFAIWARIHLGKNWGMPMSVKENPELITSGPYAYVRHPIYTGVLAAAIGSALVVGTGWLVLMVLLAIYFIYSAKKEEALLRRTFGQHYDMYAQRTKMLIPWIF